MQAPKYLDRFGYFVGLGGDKLAKNHAQGWGFVLAALKFIVPLPESSDDGS
jgi:hypothetical protein